MKEFVIEKLIDNKRVPIWEDKYGHGAFWEDIFESDLNMCSDIYEWIGREYSAKDICVMIGFLSNGGHLDYCDLGNIDPYFIVGHTIYTILRFEIENEFEEWCKEKLGTYDKYEEETDDDEDD